MKRHSHHSDNVDREFDALLASALNSYIAKQDELSGYIQKFESWNYDLEHCIFEFRGAITERFNLIPIGTFLPSKMNWCWAWANDVFPPLARNRSAVIKKLAQKTKCKIFGTPFFDITLNEIDELCALALLETGGRFVFKIKDAEPWLVLALK
jgi:hypothetical protein